jgi:hypothetical protein
VFRSARAGEVVAGLAFSPMTTGFGLLAADGVFPAAGAGLGAETGFFDFGFAADFFGDFFVVFFAPAFLTTFFAVFLVAFFTVFFTVFLAFFTTRLRVFARCFDAAALAERAGCDLRAFFAFRVLEVFLEVFFFGDATTNSFMAQTTCLD